MLRAVGIGIYLKNHRSTFFDVKSAAFDIKKSDYLILRQVHMVYPAD